MAIRVSHDDFQAIRAAAHYGHLECLQTLCADTAQDFWEYGFFYLSLALGDAAENGHSDCLEYLWDTYKSRVGVCRCENAFSAEPFECYCNPVLMTSWRDACSLAAKGGSLACLRYVYENGALWEENTCVLAARGGHLDCLRYAHEHGAPWDARVCEEAATYGHLDCLRYAHENGAPWDKETTFWAARCGNLDCLQYAHEAGCPLDMAAVLGKNIYHKDCRAYIRGWYRREQAIRGRVVRREAAVA